MTPRKWLVIRLSSAGDLVLTSPLLKLMKERDPSAEIHFVVKARYADLVRFNPNISALHLVQDQADYHQMENLRRKLAGEGFECTLDLQDNFRSIFLRRGTAPVIRKIRKEILKRAILVRTKINFYSTIRSVALKYVQTYDGDIKEIPQPEIYLPEEAVRRAVSIFGGDVDSRPSVFLCPGARHFTKRWPEDRWLLLAKELARDYRLFLLGDEHDTAVCSRIESATGAVNLAGKLSLVESTALLSHSSAVVTNDSYLMHAASALGKNVVAIFGSSVREFGFYPSGPHAKVIEVSGLRCRPCSHVGRESCPKGHFRCMLDTPPEKVLSSLTDLLGRQD